MRSDFKVTVSKDYLVFSSAHFITFRGLQCETLHGHTSGVGVTVEGSVDDECLFVVDFSILKKIVRKLTDEIDHKVLLPMKNPKLGFREDGKHRLVDFFGEHTYTFPLVDCAMMPIENTTAEMIDLLVHWRRPSVLIVYTEHDLRASDLAAVDAQGRHDANVIVRSPADRSVFRDTELLVGDSDTGAPLRIADEVQLIWDLEDLGGRDRLEAAGKVREWLLNHP